MKARDFPALAWLIFAGLSWLVPRSSWGLPTDWRYKLIARRLRRAYPRRRLQSNRQGTLSSAALGFYSAITGKPGVVVGPANSDYPITAGSSTADVQINAAITAQNTAGGGIVWILGGASTTYSISSSVVPLDKVDIYSDGCVVRCKNSAVLNGAVLDNRGAATPTLTNLTFFGLSFNGNTSNAGYTAQALTLPGSTNPVVFPTLTGQNTTVMYSIATGSVSAVSINGDTSPVGGTTGPWYCTPTDVVKFTYVSVTMNYTQNVDMWWTINTFNCRWYACTPLTSGNSAGTMAGCCFTLDAGATQGSSNNKHIDASPGAGNSWNAGIRMNGASGAGLQTTLNAYKGWTSGNILTRWIDLAQLADSNRFDDMRAPAGSNQAIGCFVGSAGTSTTGALCGRTVFYNCSFDTNSKTGLRWFILGYYQGNAGASTLWPGLTAWPIYDGGTPSNITTITDLRATPLQDYVYMNLDKNVTVNGAGFVTSSTAAPTGTVNTSMTSMGINLAITPVLTGKIRGTITMNINTATAAVNFSAACYVGTTANANSTQPPIGGAQVGSTRTARTVGAGVPLTITIPFEKSGLTLGTVYYVDLTLLTSAGADQVNATNVDIFVEETQS